MAFVRRIVERSTPLLQALDEVSPDAVKTLADALRDGLEEFEAADPNDMWNVTARFWPTTCRFTRSDREGLPGVGQDCFRSELIRPDDRGEILRMVNMGHASVVVLISLVPYLRAGHEPSVHALATALLGEADRVIHLGLPAHEGLYALLQARHESPES
ncbi:hypothetical protein [Deinococcus multiflagellatus]|uniref:Uncharacterized protein n=1 Tax=Deinococcus multiflagellatus TaxID=1656887 RepID=A0ABW1ZKL9_9DEIO|nr:hypothetical protein [Deinococcus multiflagellatus]MBZ9712500.1 hypothetical protein [Deinococcus multiflagellatus]